MSGEDTLRGYRGFVRRKLEEAGVRVWSMVRVTTSGATYEGILLPRSELGNGNHIVLKLKTGYNVGVKVTEETVIEEIGYSPGHYVLPEKKVEFKPGKPLVSMIGTGGTVASRLDYRTGAVIPAFTPQELFSAVPELEEICNLEMISLFEIFSEDMQPEYWVRIAEKVAEEINRGVDGVIIAHGTDTMHFTSAALSFMLKNLPVPVILVGSQRSSDRPSSDAAMNLISSALVAAKSDIAEVVVCMHGSSSDDYNIIHRGTRVRKMHTSRRDAFRTIGDIPLGVVAKGVIRMLRSDYKRRSEHRKVTVDSKLDPKVVLLYTYPGMQPDIVENVVNADYHGIVLAGTGLGHCPRAIIPSLKRAIKDGVAVAMTSQCLYGFVGMNVYERGRDLLSLGVIPCGNMLPETAYVKLIYVLGHTRDINEVREMMTHNMCGELTSGEPYNAYLILQGGLESAAEK
ncbi:MAG: Glu-tRNA(Gln) amidotransferase subunit GatD [Candidatus Freyarchaeota archaeon]|nr:Glu-tRNA(Gln) amidotransferase subunit GatD [Candidatus Jordarchaeia archaeon]